MTIRPGALALLAVMLLACAPPTSGRPNFLVIISDDQRWDGLGVVQRERGEDGRFPWLETPHLDQLAAEGVRFRNAFVVSSLCSPARASFLTGRYGHEHGVVDNDTPFPLDASSFASVLREAGYRTGYVGKWHMGDQAGPRPGFDFSASYLRHGPYFDATFEIDGASVETTGYVDDVSARHASGFLRREGAGAAPFLLVVGLKAPHGPRRVPPHLQGRYQGLRARPARNAEHAPPFFEELEFTPPSAQSFLRRKSEGKSSQRRLGGAGLLDYTRMATAVDETVGRLLGALDEAGLAEQTVVVFTSDNGYYLGEHGLGDKRSAYEESIRIPLLVRHPGLGAAARERVVDELPLNIDLAPTLLDLAGAAVPYEMQGRSWRPLLEGAVTSWRQSFLYEYFYTRGFPSPPIVALRTESAKLIRYPGHEAWTELFDLSADPYELDNLASRRPTLRAELESELDREAAAVGFRVPPGADPVPGDGAD